MYSRTWLSVILMLFVIGCSSNENIEVVSDSENQNTSADKNQSKDSGDQNGENSNNSSTKNEANSKTPVAQQGVIGYSAMSLKNPFFVVISKSLTAAGKKHGFKVITTDADSDVSKQANQIENFISQNVDVIVLNPTDRLSIGSAIKKANEAGIPVFTCDLQCVAEGIEIAGHIGTDNFQGGELAGQAMIEVLGDEGGEVLVLDFKQANSCVLRVNGFKKVIDAHNKGRGTEKIEIISEVNGGGDQDIGYKATVDSLQAHPNIRAVFAINDPSALGAWQAIKEAKKTDVIKIVGFDGAKAGKQAILEGKIYADPIQFPKKMGVEIMNKVLAFQSGEDYEEVELIPTSLYKKADAEKDPELQSGE